MSRIPHDTTKIFTDIFDSDNTFYDEWVDCGLYDASLLKETSVRTLYFLLYSRYANSAIANWDETQFKYKVWAIMYQYGPTWEKRVEIQKKLRALEDTDIVKGTKAINAHSYNMGDDGVIATDDPTKIDQKSSTYYEKSKIEGYAVLMDLLETDVTSEFLSRFKPLFATFVYTRPDLFVTEVEEDD